MLDNRPGMGYNDAEVNEMKQEGKRLLTTCALYALIPLLLILIPIIFAKAPMEAYGAKYNAYLLLTEFCVIALPAIIWLMTPQGREAAKDIWRDKPDASILLVIPLAVCAYFAVNGLTVMWFLLLNQFGITQMPETVPSPQNGAQLGLALMLIAASPALCEEFFFRGILQPALHRHMKPWLAIVLGGCMFGLVHGQIVALPAHVLLGITLCFVAYWTRSVWYTLLWHFIQNGIAVVIGYFSEAILEMSGGAEASAAMMVNDTLATLLSAGLMLVFFGTGALLFLALLLFVTHKRHKESKPVRAADKAPLWAYAPLLAAAGGIVYLYITGTMMLTGGGA